MEKGKKMRAVSAAVGIKDFPSVFLGLPGNLRRSALELKEVRSLCGIALMLALSVAVDQFSFYVGPVKVGLGSLVSAMRSPTFTVVEPCVSVEGTAVGVATMPRMV